MGGFGSVPGMCPFGAVMDDVGRLTGMFAAGAGGTPGAPGDDSLSPVNC
jgi:hypothetical protein